MRVSTSQLYQTATTSMLERQAALNRTQQQLATGSRLLSPADDPLATAQAQGYRQARDLTAQYVANVAAARARLAQGEGALGEAGGVLQDIRERLVQAGDGSLSDADRRALATDLQSRYDELLSIANRQDGQGRYLFAGFREDAAPFVLSGGTVSYVGDHGTRALEVSPSRTLDVGASGAAIFGNLANGNGTFVTAPDAANAGNASVSVGQVVDRLALTGHDYSIDFTIVGATTTYAVTDLTLGVVVTTGNPFRSGAGMVVDGQQVAVTGSPANGDRFRLAPATAQDMFTPIANAIAALQAPQATPAVQGAYTSARERAIAEIDQGLERVLAARSRFGAGLRELDALEDAHAGAAVQDDAEISRLTALDYAQAVSDFSREQLALEAAQKAFQGATQLSLFKLL